MIKYKTHGGHEVTVYDSSHEVVAFGSASPVRIQHEWQWTRRALNRKIVGASTEAYVNLADAMTNAQLNAPDIADARNLTHCDVGQQVRVWVATLHQKDPDWHEGRLVSVEHYSTRQTIVTLDDGDGAYELLEVREVPA